MVFASSSLRNLASKIITAHKIHKHGSCIVKSKTERVERYTMPQNASLTRIELSHDILHVAR